MVPEPTTTTGRSPRPVHGVRGTRTLPVTAVGRFLAPVLAYMTVVVRASMFAPVNGMTAA
ncbi:hypothetical protein QBL07_014090 [Gordonia rubripertincta]|uniref:hypothetical protein n=1 Tax=Gordonia rubripertincta TaxID=36822 RepID=UPI0039B4C659